MQFPVKITSSCIWVAMPVDSVILHWYACGVDGRSGGRSVYGHVITKFSRMGSLPHFLTHGAPLRASRARAPLQSFKFKKFIIHINNNIYSLLIRPQKESKTPIIFCYILKAYCVYMCMMNCRKVIMGGFLTHPRSI